MDGWVITRESLDSDLDEKNVNLDVCTHIYIFIRVIKYVQKEVPTGTGMAVYLSSNGNVIWLIFLSHHLTPIYCSVSHFKFNSFFSDLPTCTYCT